MHDHLRRVALRDERAARREREPLRVQVALTPDGEGVRRVDSVEHGVDLDDELRRGVLALHPHAVALRAQRPALVLAQVCERLPAHGRTLLEHRAGAAPTEEGLERRAVALERVAAQPRGGGFARGELAAQLREQFPRLNILILLDHLPQPAQQDLEGLALCDERLIGPAPSCGDAKGRLAVFARLVALEFAGPRTASKHTRAVGEQAQEGRSRGAGEKEEQGLLRLEPALGEHEETDRGGRRRRERSRLARGAKEDGHGLREEVHVCAHSNAAGHPAIDGMQGRMQVRLQKVRLTLYPILELGRGHTPPPDRLLLSPRDLRIGLIAFSQTLALYLHPKYLFCCPVRATQRSVGSLDAVLQRVGDARALRVGPRRASSPTYAYDDGSACEADDLRRGWKECLQRPLGCQQHWPRVRV